MRLDRAQRMPQSARVADTPRFAIIPIARGNIA
jgi:hypothetical protein